MCSQNNPADVFQTAYLAGGSNQILFALALDVSGTRVRVIFTQGFHHFAKINSKGDQFFGVGSDVILLGITTDTIDLRDARNIEKLRSNDPILNRPQLH